MDKLIKFCLKNRFFVYMIFGSLVIFGFYSITQVPMDAIPDIGENQVIVYADWEGRSPKDVENQVTYPLTTALQGIPGVKEIRGQSGFGLSMIYIIFKDNVDYYFARTRTLEKLNYAAKDLPEGVIPTLGPDGTGLGQIFWYTLESDKHNLTELRSIQDWYVRYALASVEGVSEIASIGGYVKQYQIDIDPNKLFAYGIRSSMIMEAVKKSNIDVGAKVVELNGVEFLIRGVGFIKTNTDIENIVIGSNKGIPVRIKDVAIVQIGSDFRRGILDKNGKEAVGGVVIMRYRENPLRVIQNIKAKIESISPGLPDGVKIVPFYDRTQLINETLMTLLESIIVIIFITMAVVLSFFLPFRMSMVISLTMPVAILFSFIMMNIFKIDIHIMSLAGIIIAIGTIVDMGIVVTENIHRNLTENPHEELSSEMIKDAVFKGTYEVARSVAGAILTTIIPFLAILVLQGQSAKLFHPVVYTKTFVLIGSLVCAIVLLPSLYYDFIANTHGFIVKFILKLKTYKLIKLKIIVLTVLFVILTERIMTLTKVYQGFNYNRIIEWFVSNIYMLLFSAGFLTFLVFLSTRLKSIMAVIIPWGLKNRWFLIIPAMIFLFSLYLLAFRIQNEFKPSLDEGSLLFMPVLLPSASINQVHEIMKKQNEIIISFPEVASAVGKLGRIESATDPADITMIETIINLKPKKLWRKGMNSIKLKKELNNALKIPGVSNIWTQPIQNRIDMLSTGIRTSVGIKVFGSDLYEIEKLSIKLENAIKNVPGYDSSFSERITGKPYFEYIINREEIARFGLSISDVQDVIATSIGGENLTNILIITPGGDKIPISRIADIHYEMGPAMISSENSMLRGVVYLNLKNTVGAVDFVKNARKYIKDNVEIPKGYYYKFAGDFINQKEAFDKLKFILPLCLLLIFIIIYFTFKSVIQSLIVFLAVPISLSGGLIMLWIFGFNMSIAVVVGFIALLGIAVDDGIILTTYINQLRDELPMKTVDDVHIIITKAAIQRVRPLFMTSSTTILALVPILWSTGRGSEMIKPMSIPSIGGMLIVIISIFMTPILNSFYLEWKLKEMKK